MERQVARVWKHDSDFVFIVCPSCGIEILYPISRFGGAQYVLHAKAGNPNGGASRRCQVRMIALVDPMNANEVPVEILAYNEQLEPRWREHLRSMANAHRLMTAIMRLGWGKD